MVFVRGLLLMGWLILIVSLYWDPITPILTDAGATWSPWHLHYTSYDLRDRQLVVDPYPVGNRLFWTVLVPIVPLFLMVFGHEAWRRVCPLSFASQLPRLMGVQRRIGPNLARARGVRPGPYLLRADGWLARNAWYFQFALLFLGLTMRLLGANSNRAALAMLLLTVIGAAIATGYFWGGKTWCNYICPINVVQRIYTEPRGLLESAPHISRPAIPQSMCRTTKAGGAELSACVACTRLCGDVDLEKGYWETLDNEKRADVYYMFTGLIIGFYGYYYVYAGDWNYYFSGIWTHEAGQINRIMDPGLYLLPNAWWLPKLLAAPLTLALSCAATLLVGRALQKLYTGIQSKRGKFSKRELTHHCLAVSSFVSISLFYHFGGRPNLLLLPRPVLHMVDAAILILTGLWLWQALRRTPGGYQRESATARLLGEIRELDLDVEKHLDGRDLTKLKSNEIYVLGKLLPAAVRQAKSAAHGVGDDHDRSIGGSPARAVVEGPGSESGVAPRASYGDRDTADTMDVAADAAARIDEADEQAAEPENGAYLIDEEEHALCVENYYQLFGAVLADKVEGGLSLAAAADLPDVRMTAEILRASFQVSDDEHAAMIDRLTGAKGLLAERAIRRLTDLAAFAALRKLVADGSEQGSGEQLYAVVRGRIGTRYIQHRASTLALLVSLGSTSRVDLDADAVNEVVEELLRRDLPVHGAGASFRPSGIAMKASEVHLPGLSAELDRIRTEGDEADHLLQAIHAICSEVGAVEAAVALWLCARANPPLARLVAERLPNTADQRHWLLAEVADKLRSGGDASAAKRLGMRVEVSGKGLFSWSTPTMAEEISVGSALGNTVVINHPCLSLYHLLIWRQAEGANVYRLTDAPLHLNGVNCKETNVMVPCGALLTIGGDSEAHPRLKLVWDEADGASEARAWDTVAKMARLTGLQPIWPDLLRDLPRLAERARSCVVITARAGQRIDLPDRDHDQLALMHSGEVEAVPLDDAAPHVGQGALTLIEGRGDADGEGNVRTSVHRRTPRIVKDAVLLVLPPEMRLDRPDDAEPLARSGSSPMPARAADPSRGETPFETAGRR